MMMSKGHWRNDTEMEQWKYWDRNLSHYRLIHHMSQVD